MEIVDVELVRGDGVQGIKELNNLVEINARKDMRERCGGLLYKFLCGTLATAVRLTPDRRLEICEELDDEAVMHNDSVTEAEAFLSRWRRARYLYHREWLVKPETAAQK